MPSLGIVFSVNFWIVLPRALKLAHFSDYFVRQPYIFWRELLRQQRESTTAFCSRRQQAEGLVAAVALRDESRMLTTRRSEIAVVVKKHRPLLGVVGMQ